MIVLIFEQGGEVGQAGKCGGRKRGEQIVGDGPETKSIITRIKIIARPRCKHVDQALVACVGESRGGYA